MATIHPIVRAVKSLNSKKDRRRLLLQRAAVADLSLNKKSLKKLLKLV